MAISSKIELNAQFLRPLVTLHVLESCMWLVVAVLDRADTEQLHHGRKSYWTVMHALLDTDQEGVSPSFRRGATRHDVLPDMMQ